MFNKETEYALRALVYIYSRGVEGNRPGIIEIASEIDAPQFFTAKILQKMVKLGFIKSAKGRGGGFFFDRTEGDISVRDIIVAVEGEEVLTGCGFGLKECDDNNPCPLHHKFSPIKDSLNKVVSGETIKSLAEKLSGQKSAR